MRWTTPGDQPRKAEQTGETLTPATPDARSHAEREVETIHRIVARLCPHFPERGAEEVERAVYRAYAAFQHSSVRDFIPILVERLARKDLQNS